VLTGWFDAFALAFGVVFLAELGDKTQLMVLAFSTRHRALPVILGVVTATALMMAASVLLGAALGAIVPEQLVLLLGGVAFLLFAAWTLVSVDDADEDDTAPAEGPTGRSVARSALVVGSAFAIAELGDKSMLATLTLAAHDDKGGRRRRLAHMGYCAPLTPR
jgi:putative Ca2+/H+ antiporter (TMEM165/GDT1 family)